MDNLNQQQNWPSPGNLNKPEERPMPPPPPPPEITLRTMQSDINSMKKSGGEGPVPQPFIAPVVEPKKLESAPQPKASTPETKPFMQEAIKSTPSVAAMGEALPPLKSGRGKKIILAIISIVLVVGVAAAAYFVVLPYLFPPEETTQVPPVVPPVIPPVTPEIPPVIPPVIPTATTTPEMGTTTPQVQIKTHKSLFKSAADSKADLQISGVANLTQSLISEAANKPSKIPSLKEIIISDANGQVNFNEVFSFIVPQFTASTLSNYFEEDFTASIYYDQNGQWLGLAAKPKSGANIADLKTLMSAIETVDLSNFYFVSPGTKSTVGFKDGQTGFRYITFTAPGASFNYGWTTGNLFVISTSYNGLKASLAKLGQ